MQVKIIVIAYQLCFLLLYSAFCSWDSAYDTSIFTSGSILPSEDRAWERKTAKLEKEKRTRSCLLFWAFPLLVSITIVAIAIVPSYSMSWTQGAAFLTGSELVSFCSIRGKSTRNSFLIRGTVRRNTRVYCSTRYIFRKAHTETKTQDG